MLSLLPGLLLAAALSAQDSGQAAPRTAPYEGAGLLRINPDYYRLSAETGGDFYFWAPGEFGAAPVNIGAGEGEPLLLAYGALPNGSRRFEVPVESGVDKMSLFAGIQRKDAATLFAPDGTAVEAGGVGIELQPRTHMLLASIADPAPGVWTLVLSGSGQYAVTVHARNRGDQAPDLVEFEFVELRGRPGHEGLFPIERPLKRGETVDCTARVDGTVSATRFDFVGIDDTALARVELDIDPGNSNGAAYVGQCRVPQQPFRIAVSGLDVQGRPFRRMTSALQTPE
jgi:hypothetical protein